jgi:hypothetical protein
MPLILGSSADIASATPARKLLRNHTVRGDSSEHIGKTQVFLKLADLDELRQAIIAAKGKL